MHICMITSEFPPDIAGISHYVYNLSKKLVEKGHQVTVFTRGNWKGLETQQFEGIRVFRLPFIPVFPFHIRLESFFINRYFKHLEPEFDVVHVHHPQPPHVKTKVPKIITVHTLKYIEVSEIESMGIKSLLYNIFAKYMFKEEKKVIKSSNVLTAVSNSIAREVKYACELDEEVHRVGNGVEIKQFIPKKNYEIDENGLNILYVGRLGYRKGTLDLIESVKYVKKDFDDVKYIIIGKGQIENKLKEIVSRNGLEENVKFLGFIEKEELISHYQNSTMFILPSYYEGLPTTLLEAMACGLPPIATMVDGVPEIMISGENGILIPKKAPEIIARAVITLAKNKKLRSKIGKNAYITIKNNYNWDTITNNFLSLYGKMTK